LFFRLLLLFTTIPLIELALLVELGRYVGLPATIGLVLFTGVLGAWLAKSQGLATLGRVQADLQAGRMPTGALIEGLMILVAGAVLLTPGLLTDLFGFSLLTPWFRRAVSKVMTTRLQKRFVFGPGTGFGFGQGPGTEAQAGSASEGGSESGPRVIVIEPEDDSKRDDL